MLGAPPPTFLDLGSGGGVPGLVLAVRWSQAGATLLDASSRRCRELTTAVEDLGLVGRVRVVNLRAEEASRDPTLRGSQPVVVARSFGSPAVTAECAAGLLEVGGILVVAEPPSVSPPGSRNAGHPTRWPEGPLAELGLEPVQFWAGRAGYQILRQVASCPPRYPRRTGIPDKRPLYEPAN
ncbi:MAG TPA: RsmG family class I SAM-dependent methyltransferase [Acidimicrobiales bacterium]|nr:RsmG family class I SAM-dependent methyltransferase [Acidimicrobiales bacterium]